MYTDEMTTYELLEWLLKDYGILDPKQVDEPSWLTLGSIEALMGGDWHWCRSDFGWFADDFDRRLTVRVQSGGSSTKDLLRLAIKCRLAGKGDTSVLFIEPKAPEYVSPPRPGMYDNPPPPTTLLAEGGAA